MKYKQKNKKMEKIPIYIDYFKEYDAKTLRKLTKEYYQQNIQGLKVFNKHKEITIHFTGIGRNKSVYGETSYKAKMTSIKAVVIFNLVELMQNAKLINIKEAIKDKHKIKNYLFFLNFRAEFIVGAKKHNFKIAVVVTKDLKFQYALTEI